MLNARFVQNVLYSLAGTVALVGLSCSVLVYFFHSEHAANLTASTLTDTKLYRRGLEMYGGKMNLLFDDFGRWFSSLWQGENLAISLGILTICITALLFLLARHYPLTEQTDSDPQNT